MIVSQSVLQLEIPNTLCRVVLLEAQRRDG